jgi:hypothetical protein
MEEDPHTFSHMSPVLGHLSITPGNTAVRSITWTSNFKTDGNDRMIPTPRNLSKDLNCSSPWLRSLDVDMSERYFPLRYSGATPVRTSHLSFQTVPQLFSHSPSGDVGMFQTHSSVHMSPLFSPPRQRRRLN